MDKNVYRPNDVAFFEAFLVDPITKKPIIYEKEQDLKLDAYISIVDSSNNEIVYE